MAYLTLLDLVRVGIPATMYNFGQPRVGNTEFSEFVTAKNLTPNSYRVVHFKDMVPHTPSSEFPLWFKHACIEVYEDKSHVV